MKLVLIVFCLFISMIAKANIDLRLDLPDQIRAGELLSVKAEILKIEGADKISALNGSTLEDTLYINKIGLIERTSSSPNGTVEMSIVFLRPVERMPLSSVDGKIKIYLSSVKVNPAPESKDFVLMDWKLPWSLSWWGYLLILSLVVVIVAALRLYPQWKRKKELKAKRIKMWGELLKANSEEEILSIWNNRFEYFKHFPDLEKNFRTWEKNIYPYFFKQGMNSDEKLKFQKSYQKFIAELPMRRDYGV